MSLNLKRLSLTNARLEILTRTETDLEAQFLELMKLREQFRAAQLSADLQNVARARKPAPVVPPQPPSVLEGRLGWQSVPCQGIPCTAPDNS
jgi:hypothetical protein